MENNKTLELRSGGGLTSAIDDEKIESFEKHDGGQSKTGTEGYLSEKAAEGYLSHESEDTVLADPQDTPTKPEAHSQVTTDDEYITGIKAILILAAVTGACFIMLLDISIIATVS
jgi:hypothetical protein